MSRTFLGLIGCNRQTADTFQAAATFLELCQIWGPLEPEIASKIKFAKYHSLRILKAIKAGEDPNLTNPAPEPDGEPPLDPNDPEVQILNDLEKSDQLSNTFRQPSVVEIPDEQENLQGPSAQSSKFDESINPSRVPSVLPQSRQDRQSAPQNSREEYYHSALPTEVSPLAPSSASQTASDTGGYFPTVPDTINHAENRSLADTALSDPGSPPAVILPDPSSLPPPGASGFHTSRPPPTDSLHSFPPPSMNDSSFSPLPSAPMPTYPSAPPLASIQPSHPQPPVPPSQRQQTPTQPPLPTPEPLVRHAVPAHAPAPPPVLDQGTYLNDEEAILKAQKHARWAISALNFEDVNTAVKELRGALESLGIR